jgi:uncharacterized membrane protein YkvA (DUF1232 family)
MDWVGDMIDAAAPKPGPRGPYKIAKGTTEVLNDSIALEQAGFRNDLQPGAIVQNLRSWAGSIKRDVIALYLASRDPRVPWYAKALAAAVAGYALSPIDLIPDFIPVLGYVDDVLLVPVGILLVVKLIPPSVMEEHRRAAAIVQDRPVTRKAALVIIVIWIAAIALVGWLAYQWIAQSSFKETPPMLDA